MIFQTKMENSTQIEIIGAYQARAYTIVSLWNGDITALKIDAIVNAANTELKKGGGVDGRIHDMAGDQIQIACNMLGGVATGRAKMTPGYNLPAKYVIHTVGPRNRD